MRVWYAPSNGLGLTDYPAFGFIYPSHDDAAAPIQMASLKTTANAYATN